MNRREVLLVFTSVSASLSTPTWSADDNPWASIRQIEARVGGRLGLYVLDTSTGKTIEHRPDERFALCSTFKWLLAAQLLANVDRGSCSLEETVEYNYSDLLDYAPVTSKHVEQGRLTLDELARAIITVSDNTAANLILRRLGGPQAFTAYARSLGDSTTRLDRNEPELNSNTKNGLRDTPTPRAMVTALQSVFIGNALSQFSRARLLGWLIACETGHNRLRGGLPKVWSVGDKTGSGGNNAANDVAVALPPGRKPILIAAYMSESMSDMQMLNTAHVDVARTIARTFGPGNDA